MSDDTPEIREYALVVAALRAIQRSRTTATGHLEREAASEVDRLTTAILEATRPIPEPDPYDSEDFGTEYLP